MSIIIGTGRELTEPIVDKMFALAEEFFATESDHNQIPVNIEALEKLKKIHSATVLFRLEDDELVSWVVTVPTERRLMQQFMSDEITERDLLEHTPIRDEYEALYLCAAFTAAEHRRKGYVLGLFAEALRRLPLAQGAPLFTWPISFEGKKTAEKLYRLLPRPLHIKE